MDTPEIADAARLVADAPPSGVLSPRELGLGAAWLDLRRCQPEVSPANTLRVVQTLAPSLVLSEEARLLISTGPSASRSLARTAADALCRAEQHGAQIAVVRGDDVLARLEEFAQADPPSLGEHWRSACAAWAIPPAAVLRDAVEQNAAVTLSHMADHDAIRLASSLNEDRDDPADRLVLRLITGRRLSAFLPIEEDRLRREAKRYAPDGCDWRLAPSSDGVALVAESRDYESLHDFSQRLALVLPETPTPLSDLIVTLYDEVVVQVDPELLEFGLDIRPASEWVED